MEQDVASPDVQAQQPPLAISLAKVGVCAVEKIIRLKTVDGEQLFSAVFECVVDLGADQKGAHMSRFEEVVNETIGEVVLGGEAFRAESLAEQIAITVREKQNAFRAQVDVTARYPEHKTAPLSGIITQEIYTLHGTASATASGVKKLVGVSAQGMTACPCAQQMIEARATKRLNDQGFDQAQIKTVFEAVPVATHNQRGLGTVKIGLPAGLDYPIAAADLLAIVEESMSSEIYELMKRTDEAEVVEKAHRRPRFVEDCVREMIKMIVERFKDLPDQAFVFARQENLESIHQHNVIAECYGELGELRKELADPNYTPEHKTLPAWLEIF